MEAAGDLADELLEHPLGHVVVGDDALTQGTDGHDVAGGTAQHGLGVCAHAEQAARDSLEVARSLGIHIERTKICGGGAKSPLWKKIIANVMNLKVDVPENEEGPSMGGAMLAAVGCGEYPDVETICTKLVRVVDTVEPEPELVAKYEEKYRKFRKLYPAMKELFR